MSQENSLLNPRIVMPSICKASGLPYRKMLSSLFVVVIALFLNSCTGVGNKNIVYKGQHQYPPYLGEVTVFYREHGVPHPGTYELIATVGATAYGLAGTPAQYSKELHDWIKKEAAKAGGNAVIIHCGALGSIDNRNCYGDVIRLK